MTRIDAATQMASARRAAHRVLSGADLHLPAAEIHLKVEQTQTCTATLPGAHLVQAAGSVAHACVRAWTQAGQALVCVEDATREAMAWALELAGRTAATAKGTGPAGPPVPAADQAAVRSLPAGPAFAHDLEPLVRALARAARGSGLPVRDVRLTSRREEIATVSTTGIDVAERRDGHTAAAYVSFSHPLEPADALTSTFHSADPVTACDRLLLEVHEQWASAAEAIGDPVTSVPSGIPTLCRPRVTARLLTLAAARNFGGHRARGARTPAVQWSDRLHVVEDPTDGDNPQRRRFDDEGLPTGPLTLVTDGVQVTHLHTTATAAAVSRKPNACAVRGLSHLPVPGFRGLDLRPTPDGPDALPHGAEELFVVDDLIVSQEAAAGRAALVVLGRLRVHGTVRPVRLSTVGLLDDFIEHARHVAPDGCWDLDGVRGRSVLIDRFGR